MSKILINFSECYTLHTTVGPIVKHNNPEGTTGNLIRIPEIK
jgi:hypothetical protein